jgi:DNA-binding SARP family transcriptional activator
MPIKFRVLGPVEVWVGRTRIVLAGPRQERILVALLLAAGRVVPVGRLIDAVWGDRPPATARRQVQDLICRLRRDLIAAGAGVGEIQTVRDGYALRPDGHDSDLRRFEELVARARARATDDPAGALVDMHAALGLWRGAAPAGLAGLRRAAEEEKLRLEIMLALADRFDDAEP